MVFPDRIPLTVWLFHASGVTNRFLLRTVFLSCFTSCLDCLFSGLPLMENGEPAMEQQCYPNVFVWKQEQVATSDRGRQKCLALILSSWDQQTPVPAVRPSWLLPAGTLWWNHQTSQLVGIQRWLHLYTVKLSVFFFFSFFFCQTESLVGVCRGKSGQGTLSVSHVAVSVPSLQASEDGEPLCTPYGQTCRPWTRPLSHAPATTKFPGTGLWPPTNFEPQSGSVDRLALPPPVPPPSLRVVRRSSHLYATHIAPPSCLISLSNQSVVLQLRLLPWPEGRVKDPIERMERTSLEKGSGAELVIRWNSSAT